MSNTRDAIRAVLQSMSDSRRLTPENLVFDARDENHPAHKQFEWDDTKAAQLHREDQARRLISSFQVVVTVRDRELNISEFVENPIKETRDEQGYVSINTIRSDKDMAKAFMDRELGVALTYVNKTRDYAQVLGFKKRVESISSDIDTLRQDVYGVAQ